MKDTQKAQSVEETAISIIKKEKGEPLPSEIECFKLGAQWQQSQPGIKQWVSVDDRLPELGVMVLCFREHSPEVNFRDETPDFYQYSHWRPLPEPPNSTTTPKSDMVSKEKVIEILEDSKYILASVNHSIFNGKIQECITKIKELK